MSEETTEAPGIADATAPVPKPRRRVLRRVLIGAGAVFAVLLVTGALLYFLGGM